MVQTAILDFVFAFLQKTLGFASGTHQIWNQHPQID